MKTKFLAVSMLAMGMAFAALPASAGYITGAITMSGDFVPTGGLTIGTATGIDFVDDDFKVDGTTEDFALAGIAQGDVGAITDFTFVGAVPAFDLWSIGGFTFNMTTTNIVFQGSFFPNGAEFLLLTGNGYISGNGYLETYGSWNLSANTGGSLFNFSAGTAAPEPGTLALLGLGFLGMLAGRRRRG